MWQPMTRAIAEPRSVCARRGPRGFALLESLVAILLFAFGVLGVVGLQAAMTKAQTASKFRADAAFLASELIASMWLDSTHLADYTTTGCPANPRCQAWSERVRLGLPAGQAELSVVGSVVEITIHWTSPGEGRHSHTMATAIRI
jgi:type IV pilus assembly protein PilV